MSQATGLVTHPDALMHLVQGAQQNAGGTSHFVMVSSTGVVPFSPNGNTTNPNVGDVFSDAAGTPTTLAQNGSLHSGPTVAGGFTDASVLPASVATTERQVPSANALMDTTSPPERRKAVVGKFGPTNALAKRSRSVSPRLAANPMNAGALEGPQTSTSLVPSNGYTDASMLLQGAFPQGMPQSFTPVDANLSVIQGLAYENGALRERAREALDH